MKITGDTVRFITIASGAYCDYVPLYIYFITKAYPDDFVRVYIQGKEDKKLLKQINGLVQSDNWSVIFNYRNEYPNDRFTLCALRFLIVDEVVESFPYTYIGDVDILIAKENVPLVIQHKEHIEFLGIPYSNIIRQKKDKRLTGLHFVKSFEYYNRIKPHIGKYLNQLKAGRTGFKRDDELLYALCNDAGMIPKYRVSQHYSMDEHSYNTQTYIFRPHHGIHLRSFIGCSDGINEGVIWCRTTRAYKSYLKAIRKAYNEDVATLVKELHPDIQLQIKKMLEC